MANVETVEVIFGREVIPIPYNSILVTPCVLYGYSIYETTGSSSAQLNIYNSGTNAGHPVIPILLAKGQSAEDWFGPQGITLRSGVYPNVVSGSVDGSMFVHFPHNP